AAIADLLRRSSAVGSAEPVLLPSKLPYDGGRLKLRLRLPWWTAANSNNRGLLHSSDTSVRKKLLKLGTKDLAQSIEGQFC
ncbi:unnamed protein product, partial [Urochloa humidicola]